MDTAMGNGGINWRISGFRKCLCCGFDDVRGSSERDSQIAATGAGWLVNRTGCFRDFPDCGMFRSHNRCDAAFAKFGHPLKILINAVEEFIDFSIRDGVRALERNITH